MKILQKLYRKYTNQDKLSEMSGKISSLEKQLKKMENDKDRWKEAWWQYREIMVQNRHWFYLLGWSDHKKGFDWDSRRDIVTVIARENIKKELNLN